MKKTPTWQSSGVQGLYLNTVSGIYHSRFRMNGKRTFRSLKTKVLTVAKLKHAKRGVDVEKDRQRGADLGTEYSTLGALFREMVKRLDETDVADNTVVGRRNNMARLRTHWVRGDFGTFLARNCTADVIVELRQHLTQRAQWRYNFQKKKRTGFSRPTVNQTLWVLRVMLDIAIEKHVVIENPFAVSSVLRKELYLKTANWKDQVKKLYIPEVVDMNRIFAEIARVPVGESFNPNPEQRVYLERMAREMSDHAQLIAFSGMRLRESWQSTIGDDLGEDFKIWGTKSKTSERTIQVNPALRTVLDRIKTRRIGSDTKLIITREPLKAMNRACSRLGLPKLTNHRLRHFFASVCIASGIDVPTVSNWLGHADGGALAMSTYGHLLTNHARAAAKRVDFTSTHTDAQSNVG